MPRKATYRHPQWVGPPPCSWLEPDTFAPRCNGDGHYLTDTNKVLCRYHGDRARRDGRSVRLIPARAMGE